MDIKSILKTDLVNMLLKYRKKYENSYSVFDHNLVKLYISENQLSARCYSNAIEAFFWNNHITIYESKKFKSFYEARGHAEMEIGKAMLRFPKTRFVLSAENSSGWTEDTEYRNGERRDVGSDDSAYSGKVCYCGARFEGTTCPKCGEWHLD